MATLAHMTAVFIIGNNKRATINLDFESNLALGNIDLDAIVSAAYGGWSGSPNLRENFRSDVKLNHVEAYPYDIVVNPSAPPAFRRSPTAGPRTSVVADVGGSDTSGLGSLTPQDAVVVSFYSALISKRGRGRCYLPPISDERVDNGGVLTSSFQAQLEGDFNDWVVGIQNGAVVPQTFTHVVVSLAGNTVEPVVSRRVKSRIDTQRRRLAREIS